MSVLTYINNIPLYSNINEALVWAEYNGITGYHTYKYSSVTGYMGGINKTVIPSYPKNLPEKPKTKKGYLPPVGSTTTFVKDGVATKSVITTRSKFDEKGRLTNVQPVDTNYGI